VASSTQTRAYVASHFALELDGQAVIGFCRSLDGGNLKAEILTYQMGNSLDVWRQMGRPKFDDITFQVGMAMSSSFYDWISAFFNRQVQRKSGAILGADFNYNEKTRRTFTDALISEIQIPALDGSSKEAAYMTVKLTPEAMSYQAGSGAKLQAPQGVNQPSKLWMTSNFRFTVDGYEQAFKRVLKIDGITIKQQILEYPSGNLRFPVRVPGRLEYPNINVYIPEVDVAPLRDYVKGRIVEGKAGGGLNGAIEFMGPDKATLCTIHLKGMDILSYEPEKFDANADALHRVKVQLQVEKMEFEYEDDAQA
jgi:hypothetical protein